MNIQTELTTGGFSLIIDSVKVPGTEGEIGMTSCPGKPDDYFFESPEHRLKADIETIRIWGASVVVTLIEEQELHIYNVDKLFTTLSDHGLRSLHLPIRNRNLPGPEFEQQWDKAGEELRSILKKGGKIVLHCKEGVGRTGLIAARLLIEMGVEATEAVKRVRKARSGALETLTHERYCTSLRSV